MEEKKQLRGFAALTPERQREIASMGGKAAHEKGAAYEWTGGREGSAAVAGRKGGKISRGGRGKA